MNDAEFWSATFAGVSATAALATAGVAGWTLTAARQDSRDRTRPVVTASLRRGPRHVLSCTYFVVHNSGGSNARKVRVTFQPELPDVTQTPDGQSSMIPFISQRYENEIPILPAGEMLKNVYYYTSDSVAGNVEDVPDEFAVEVAYEDDHGRPYRDRFPLNVRLHSLDTASDPGRKSDSELRLNRALEAATWELWEGR